MGCIYCSEDSLAFAYDTKDVFGDEYQVLRCTNCGTHQLHPFPSNEQLNQAYGEDYYGEGEEKFNPLVEYLLDKYRRAKAHNITKHLSANAAVLDIGCGNGRFLSYIKTVLPTSSIYGVELPGGSAERAKRVPNLHLFEGDFLSLDITSRFDAVSLVHVIEHLAKPKETLHKVNELLSDNGLLYIAYPNIESQQAKQYKGQWLHLDPPRHLNMMPPSLLKLELNELGYQLVDENHSSLEYNPFGMIQSWLNAISSKREILYEWLKGNKEYLTDVSSFTVLLHVFLTACLLPFAIVLNYIESHQKRGACIELLFKKVDQS